MPDHIVVLLAKPEGRKLVRKHCLENGFDIHLMQELVEAELEQVGKQRKAGLWERFDDILDRMDIESDASQKD
ncbi:hypothetical protein [Benzoatithermus flavus]|uniref:DNA modification system-associated small protein n=1 Tax=Benzoatithermus flavus TaxID=3108223 RepID=A0ABU8XN94_9PROT